jgi:DNA polymerase-1
MFVASPGCVLFACDYSTLELCALAHKCQTMHLANPREYPPSRMLALINGGMDCHKHLGEQIMKATGGNPTDGIDYRQMAKAANFGYPGGLGAEKFVKYAKDSYGVTISLELAGQIKKQWLAAYPEMAMHLKPPPDPKHADRYLGKTTTGRTRANADFCSACNVA